MSDLDQVIPAWKRPNAVNHVRSWPPESGKYFELYHHLKTLQQPSFFASRSSRQPYKVSQIRCINCSKIGHLYRNCTSAVTSFGIIAITKYHPERTRLLPAVQTPQWDHWLRSCFLCPEHTSFQPIQNKDIQPGDLLFCMVQRKDTMGYIDFVRGKYPDSGSNSTRKDHLVRTFVSEMTCGERKRLLDTSFDDIWDLLWSFHSNRNYIKQKEYKDAKNKFNSFDFKTLFEENPSHWPSHEWGFPKGRKNISESNIDCAIREFCEETGYTPDDITLINSIPPIVEEFQGTNGLSYKHVWYCASISDSVQTPSVNPSSHLQAGEIANVGWFTQAQCLELFRSYETSKSRIMNKLVHKYGDLLLETIPLSTSKQTLE